jgi:hypothetical protein
MRNELEEKRPLRRPRHRRIKVAAEKRTIIKIINSNTIFDLIIFIIASFSAAPYIRIDLRRKVLGGVDWMHLAEDRD